MTKEKNKDKLKNWITDRCMKGVDLNWKDIPNQSFLKNEKGNLLELVSKDDFLKMLKSIIDLDEIISITYQEYSTREIVTLNCPNNPGYYWAKCDKDGFRKEIFDFFVLYVIKLNDEQIIKKLASFLQDYNKLYYVEKIYQQYAKENEQKRRTYLLYLITILFLYQNEENIYKKEHYKRDARGFLDMIKYDFFNEGQQFYEETFGMKFDDDVRINLLMSASERKHIEASYELAEFYKFSIGKGNAKYSWNDVVSVYNRIESIDDSGRASWALGKIAEKGYYLEKTEYALAKKYYQSAIKYGYSKAYNSLANLYRESKINYDDTIKDIEDVINLYKIAIEKGNIYANINLGHIYSTEKYNCIDLREAEKNYRKAEERNSELAKFFRAKLYFHNREYFAEIDDSCLANMFIKMVNYSNQFKYLGKVYEYLAKLLKNNGSLETEIRRGISISVNEGSLIDKLIKLAWENGNREVIYELAISTYNNEEDPYLKRERVLHYLNYKNAVGISDDVRVNCEKLYDKLNKVIN